MLHSFILLYLLERKRNAKKVDVRESVFMHVEHQMNENISSSYQRVSMGLQIVLHN